jgi:hypothetical protein
MEYRIYGTLPYSYNLLMRKKVQRDQSVFEDLIHEYSKREPPESDSWNPLGSDVELWHRMRLFLVMAWALRQLPLPIAEASILDVGCGVGRSTRMLLDFGARPGNVVGVDLRPEAIAFAGSMSPSIRFQVVQDFDGWPPAQSFHLCLQCTVFSSIRGTERRMALANKMESMLLEGGYIFWWDAIKANSFAGGDLLEPLRYFFGCEVIADTMYSLRPTVTEAVCRRNFWTSLMADFLARCAGCAPSHRAVLLKKIDAR